MEITIYYKNVYGINTCYIFDPFFASKISQLTGKKTLSQNDKDTLSSLGFIFKEVIAPKE